MSDSDFIQRMTIEWTRAQPSVGRFVCSFLRDRAEADDVLQEVALVIVEKFDDWDPERPFVAWALGIARHVVLTHLRARYRSTKVELSDAVDLVAASYEKLEPQAELMKDSLADCLGQVSGQSRQVLALRYTDGLELKQIAERLSMTASNVGVLLHRVRSVLRKCVDQRLKSEGLT
jgi:RNA polymerase sigma-70 factor (ECF subfamily)